MDAMNAAEGINPDSEVVPMLAREHAPHIVAPSHTSDASSDSDSSDKDDAPDSDEDSSDSSQDEESRSESQV